MNESPTRTPEIGDENAQAEVSLGWLLSPEEFAQECARTRQRPTYTSWAVGMDLPDAVVQVMESIFVPAGTRLALFLSSNGPVYPVVVFQAGALQIRAMLSLNDPRTQEWFKEAVTTGRMRLAINVAETAQLAVAHGNCDARPLVEAEDAIQRCVELGRTEGLLDKLQLAERLLKPGTVPSGIPGFEVQTVRLVIVVGGGERLLKDAEAVPAGEVIH